MAKTCAYVVGYTIDYDIHYLLSYLLPENALEDVKNTIRCSMSVSCIDVIYVEMLYLIRVEGRTTKHL